MARDLPALPSSAGPTAAQARRVAARVSTDLRQVAFTDCSLTSRCVAADDRPGVGRGWGREVRRADARLGMIMRRFAVLPLSAILISLLVPQTAASTGTDLRAHGSGVVAAAEPAHRPSPPKPPMPLADRRQQVKQDRALLGHRADGRAAGAPTRSAQAAIPWAVTNEGYSEFRWPGVTVWGDVGFECVARRHPVRGRLHGRGGRPR